MRGSRSYSTRRPPATTDEHEESSRQGAVGHIAEHPPDREIVERVLAGETQVFGTLVDRYQDRMFRYARHMGCDPDQAGDAVQDSMVRAFRHLARCGDPDRFAGWLFRIVSNTCKSHILKAGRNRSQSLDEFAAVVPSDRVGPVEASEASEAQRRIRAALQALPHDQREALVLRYLEERSVGEIEALTGLSSSAVKMRLKRGRDALREPLASLNPGEGGDPNG